MVYTIKDLIGSADCQSGPDQFGRWSRAIPQRYFGGQLKGAWAVWLGRAVAVRYPESGELEQALRDSGGIHVSANPKERTMTDNPLVSSPLSDEGIATQLTKVRDYLCRLAKSVTKASSYGFQVVRRDRENGDIEYQIFADTKHGTQIAWVQSTKHDADFIAACLAQAPLFEELLRGVRDGRREEPVNMNIISVPRVEFVLGEPKEHGSSLRQIYGPEDENGERQIVGYADQSSPHFDRLVDLLGIGGRREEPATRFVWLLEREGANGRPQYWNGGSIHSHTNDPWLAIHFAREVDANNIDRAGLSENGWRAVEHGFAGTDSARLQRESHSTQ